MKRAAPSGPMNGLAPEGGGRDAHAVPPVDVSAALPPGNAPAGGVSAMGSIADGTFNDWDLVALTNHPVWLLVLAALVLVAAVLLSWTGTKGAPLKTRLGLLSLRTLAAVAVFLLLLEPGRRLLATSRQPDRAVVVVDTSASMTVGDGPNQRIRVAARAALDVVDDLKTRDPIVTPEVWLFDERFTAANTDDLRAFADGSRTATGKATRLPLPFAQLAQASGVGDTGSDDGSGSSGNPLGAVILISDGADTTGLPLGLTGDLRAAIAQLGKPLQAPVHTVVVGADSAFKDINLERAIADEFAFVRNPMTIDVVVRQRGFAGTVLPLALAEDGVVVARTDLTLKETTGADELRGSFTFTPQRAGKRLYTITAPVLDGEAISENNRLDFTVKLIRDRIRVLQVSGRPSWDERFVRRLLKENPSVDLISFFILRSTTDISNAPNSELSLIPFPTKELFTEQLSSFDVVIFQDFNYRPYNMGVYLKNVAEYVRGGGGFLMLGGDLGFSEGDYAGTPIADVLPVRLRGGRGHLDTEDFHPQLTDAGRHHPITDIRASDLGVGTGTGTGTGTGVDVSNPFSILPPLQGLNLVAGLQDGAVALLTHPFQNGDDGQPQPVIAVRDVGDGRSVSIMTDTTWHWSLPQVGASSGGSDAHRKLLANTLRWLIRDPDLSRVSVLLDADARGVEPETPVQVEVRAVDARYQPDPGATVKVTVVPLESRESLDGNTAGATTQGLTEQNDGVTGTDGRLRFSVLPSAAGAWRVKVDVSKDGRLVGSDEEVFVVRQASLEKLYAEARPELLKGIAAAGAGRAVTPDDVRGLPVLDHGKTRVHRQQTEAIWSRSWVLILVVGLLAIEWWWRRRRGFA